MKCKKQIVYGIMKKCIFCGRTEAEFEKRELLDRGAYYTRSAGE